nr:hypothetical protein [Candidatus Njordarchaeum guaymaensis]
MGTNFAKKPRQRKQPVRLELSKGGIAARDSADNSDLGPADNSLRALWIVEPAGPCLHRVVIDNRFLKYDENLFGGFFVALQAFAQCIESDEAQRLDLKDMTFAFVKSPRAIVAGVSDKGVDVTPLLARVSQAFNEIISKTRSCPFNPLIPSDMRELEQTLSERIQNIVHETKTTSHGSTGSSTGSAQPKLDKPLTETLDRRPRQDERSGTVAVELANYVKGKKKVEGIGDEARIA